MKNKKTAFYFFITIVFLIFLFNIPHRLENIKSVHIAGQDIKVDLALTEAQREQGLSGRQSLNENEGMLFVFRK